MTILDTTISEIAKFHAEVGSAEFSRLSGLAYTTVNDAAARGFRNRSIEVFETLAATAKAHAKKRTPPAKPLSTASA